MKKQRKYVLLGVVFMFLFAIVSSVTFYKSSQKIQEGYLEAEGNAAENFAILTASMLQLNDADVERLKNYTYAELQQSKENQGLKKMMSDEGFTRKVDYAYVMVHLPEEEVKYHITEQDTERFDAPIGTALDVMWLLDVNVGYDLEEDDVYDELNRYSYYIEEDDEIFNASPTYIYNSSEWGEHICGYAPIYTAEGNYIGVVGVELQTGDYNKYCGDAVFYLGLVLVVSLLLLAVLCILVIRNVFISQYEKIYTDSLTKVYNRSYYNNLFTRRMNQYHYGKKLFAFFICDVDLFKKVNDTFGHEIGDEVLIELGEILISLFGREHVARFGGEEFVGGFWALDEKEIEDKLTVLFQRMEQHIFTTRQIHLSISLGCSYARPHELHGWLMSGMLHEADALLYEAKEGGRKQYKIREYTGEEE